MQARSRISLLGWLALSVASVVALGGCASDPAPPALVLEVPAARYDAAFDAAEMVARRHGLPPVLRDRRGGILQTEPSSAASVLEPADASRATADERVAGTLAHLRRRARFEFLPLDPPTAPIAPDGAAVAAPPISPAPDLLGLRQDELDLLDWPGPIELRVWVEVERSHLVGYRRDTWTRRATSRTVIVPTDDEREAASFWVPVARDRSLEARMLHEIEQTLRATPETTD